MAEKRQLIKIVCTAVVLITDGDLVKGEETSSPRNCYNPDDIFQFWNDVTEEVKSMNPSRQQRRK